MKGQSLINEVFWLRSIACLAVTLGHSIHNGYLLYPDPAAYHTGVYILNMSIFFAVPVFVFISEFLLANKYMKKVPKGFIKKRVQTLLAPYLFMNFVFAFLLLDTWTLQGFMIRLIVNIFLGKSAVYFIIIIFQFYFLHLLLRRYLNKLSARIVIPLAFLINFIYLACFNFVEPPNNAVAEYIWEVGFWLPFVGWIFYFVLGFYCGKNYDIVLKMLRNKWIRVMPFISLSVVLLMNSFFILDWNSKRVDMLVYSSSVIFFIMYLSTKFKRVPKFVMFISNYSFSIFLLNVFFLGLLKYIRLPAFLNILTYSISIFFITLFLCICTAYILNKFNFGQYLVGRVMNFKVK